MVSDNTKLVPAICTKCAGQIQANPTQEKAICEYCGTSYFVEKAIQNYNVNNATIERVESISINKRGATESVLNFIERQQEKKQQKIDGERRRREEEERIQDEKRKKIQNQLFNKQYLKRNMIVLVVLFVVIPILGFMGGLSESYGVEKINMPASSSELEGKNYQDVIAELQDAGFTNIKTDILDDLVIGLLVKDGNVEQVKVDRFTSFSTNSSYPKDVPIVITYHTFPSTKTDVPDTTVTSTSELSNGRNVSGFDIKANQTVNWYGLEFSIPAYYDVLDKRSTDIWKSYYPEKEEYYASILFQSQDFSGTEDDFNNQMPSIVKDTINGEYLKKTKIEKSEKTSIAGLPGWTITFSGADTDGDGVVSTGRYSFAYNMNTGKIVMISCVYDSNDASKYNYLGDYKKVLETAKLIVEPLNSNAINSTNSVDFAAIMSLKDPGDPLVQAFAEAHKGDVVEFDGCVGLILPHNGMKTRFDVLLVGGDYIANKGSGAYFSFIDKNFYDMNVLGADTVTEGMNFHIEGKIKGYNAEGKFIEIDPISLEAR